VGNKYLLLKVPDRTNILRAATGLLADIETC